jgi:glycosyltransferase involved in cell wall biosynthesis
MQKCTTNLLLISVIVCTYNRANILKNVLTDLCNQKLSKRFYEIIVVDNNSKDNTRKIVKDYCRMYPNINYKLETRQGLSNARNRGWKEACGQYVGYIDDDCRIPEDWLSVAKNIIERLSPGVFGGPFYPFYTSSKPYWFKDSYGSQNPLKKAKILMRDEVSHIFGGNMFFGRSVLEKTGGFNPRLGMCGTKIAYSEETELLRKISLSEAEVTFYFDPELYVYHHVPSRKMKISWIIKTGFQYGRSSYEMNIEFKEIKSVNRKSFKIRWRIVRKFLAIIKITFSGIFMRNKNKHRYIQNYVWEELYPHVKVLGRLFEEYHNMRSHNTS